MPQNQTVHDTVPFYKTLKKNTYCEGLSLPMGLGSCFANKIMFEKDPLNIQKGIFISITDFYRNKLPSQLYETQPTLH